MKKTWTGLLLILALAIVLAAPAMAAEDHVHGTCGDTTCCTHDDTWTALKADTTFEDGGKYYVPEGGITASYTISKAIEVTICLNGQEWTAAGDVRNLTVTGAATVNIVDCSEQTESTDDHENTTSVSAGKMVGADVTAGGTVAGVHGGAINVNAASAVINLYNGTITGGTAVYGGNVYMKGDNACFNMYGGTITGGTAYNRGGNINMESGTLMVNGANAVIANGKTLGGKIGSTDYSSNDNGGNIWTTGGTMELRDGIIRDGNATGGTAGNVRIGNTKDVAGTFIMTGGTIIGGSASAYTSANIQAVGAALNLSGGQIDGYVEVYSAKSVTVSGSIQLYAESDGEIVSGMILGNVAKNRNIKLTIGAAGLDAEAKVAVSKDNSYAVIDKIADETLWESCEEYLRKEQLVGFGTTQLTYEAADADAGTAEAIYSRNSEEVWHCYCGYGRDKHELGCIGYDVKWTEWTTRDITASGNYYLTAENAETLATEGQSVIRSRSSAKTGTASDGTTTYTYYEFNEIDVVIDLNGCNLTKSSSRALQLWYEANLTLCNSVVDENGDPVGGVVAAPGISGTSDSYQVLQILSNEYSVKVSNTKVYSYNYGPQTVNMLRGVTLKYDNTYESQSQKAYVVDCACNFNMYGGTIQGDLDKTMTQSGGVVGVTTNGAFTMYPEATIIGGAAQNGGAVYVRNTGRFICEGGTIIGGTATTSGGAVYITGGTFAMNGGTITGGTATEGGAVYMAGGTCNMNGGTINGSTVNGQGGAVYISGGTFNLYNGTITGGKVSAESDAFGGNIYMAGGIFNAMPNPDGAGANDKREITGGTAYSTAVHAKGGNIYIAGGSLNLDSTTVSGGTAEYAGTANKFGYGGNIYLNADVTVALSNGTVISGGTTKTTGTWAPGGNIMMDAGTLTIDGETTTITGGATVTKSATTAPGVSDSHNLYINSTAEVIMNNGVIENTSDGAASILIQAGKLTINGGELVVTSTGSRNIQANKNPSDSTSTGMLTINGGKIHGGNTTGRGGNIDLEARVYFEMTGGEVYDGTAGTSGGNIYFVGTNTVTVSNVVTTFTQEITISGGKIYNGTAASNGGNVYVGDTAVVSISGGEITGGTAGDLGGGLYMNGASLTMSGAPKIAGNTASNLYLPTGKTVTIGEGGMTTSANVGVTCEDAGVGRDIAVEVENQTVACGLGSDDGEYAVRYNADDKVMELSDDLSGATINGSGAVYDLLTAIELAVESDFVQLTGNCETDVTISKNLFLDLNGYTLSGNVTITEGHVLKLFDTATADYAVEGNATDGFTGYGKITGTVTGDIARTCNTPKATYGSNYRYLVIEDSEGYHAHRIYLAVKSTVLYPTRPAVNYRTVLRCDAVVAKYVNAEGGAYGAKVIGYNGETALNPEGAYGTYTEGVAAWDGSDDNSRIAQLGNIITTAMDLPKQIYRSETVTMYASAYIKVADDFGQDEITSSQVKKSMKEVVQAADAMTDLSLAQQASLYNMYKAYKSLMDSTDNTWSLKNIPNYGSTGVEYYCLCGDKTSTNNPCAVKGHPQLYWQPWTDATSLPTEEGNYFLTDDVTLGAQVSIPENVMICIDTRGYDITTGIGNRVALVRSGSVLNLTNTAYDPEDTETMSYISVSCPSTGTNGGLLILEGGNVSIYDGVTLKAVENHKIENGLVDVGGDLNIYGGYIQGTEVTGNGGAILVRKSGYFFINEGTVTGGTAALGGAIYSQGEVEIGGDAVITGGTAQRGGTIAIEGGIFLIDSVELSGGTAVRETVSGELTDAELRKIDNFTGRGAAIYISDGELTINDAVIYGGLISNAESEGARTDEVRNQYGGSVLFADGGTIQVTGSVLSGYTAARIAKRGGTVFLNSSSAEMEIEDTKIYTANANINGAAIMLNNGGQLTVKGDSLISGVNDYNDPNAPYTSSTIYGGVITLDGSKSELTMEGGTIQGGNTQWGGAVQVSSGQFKMTGGTITGGQQTDTGNAKYGGGNVRVAGGTFEMTGGKIIGGTSPNGQGGGIFLYTGTLKLSGTAQVTGNTGGNVYVASGKQLTLGQLTDGASIGVTFADGSGYISKAHEANPTNLSKKYIYADDGEPDISCDGSTNQLYLGRIACLCGANEGEDHLSYTDAEGVLHGCDGTMHFWTEWTETNSLPNESGYWYLSEDVQYTELGTTKLEGSESLDVVVDLNGHQITMKDYNRAYALWEQTDSATYTLTLTDSSKGHTATITLKAPEDNNNQSLGVWLRGSHCTFNFYRGTLNGAGAYLVNGTSSRSGVVIENGSGTVNMYGGTIIGGYCQYRGGAVHTTGAFTMYGGIITGGEAGTYGGTVSITGDGSFYQGKDAIVGAATVNGVAYPGGKANNGGVYAINSGTASLIIDGGTTGGGYCRTEWYKTTVKDGVSSTGTATRWGGGLGGTIMVYNGTVEIKNGATINGSGTVSVEYKRIRTTGSDGTVTTTYEVAGEETDYVAVDGHGGSAICAIMSTSGSTTSVTVSDSVINGYVAGPANKRGGALFITGSGVTCTLNNTTVNAGWSTTNGAVALVNGGAQLTMNGTSHLNGANIADFKSSGITYGGAVTVENAATQFVMNDRSQITGYKVGHNAEGYGGGALYINTTTVTMNDNASISGGSYTATKGGGGNVLVKGSKDDDTGAVTNGCLIMNDNASISGGSSKNGGNVLVHSYGVLTMNGDAVISGGQTTSGGGNVRVNSNGSFTMNGGTVSGGKNTGGNGGNIFVAGGGEFTLEDGTVSGGITVDTGGNIYSNGTVNIRGGKVIEAIAKYDTEDYPAGTTDHEAGNIQIVNSELNLSGGYMDTGVNVNSHSSDASLTLTGSAKLEGTGLNLTHGTTGTTDADGNELYRDIPTFTLTDIAGLSQDTTVKIRYRNFKAPYADGLCILAKGDLSVTDWAAYEVYAKQVFVSSSTACEVTWEDDGIWLRPTASMQWNCLCGANADEDHLGECDGYDICWNAWNLNDKKYLPNIPGNWYLTSTSTEDYIQLTACATFNQDYYLDGDGNLQRAYRFTSTVGSEEDYESALYFDSSIKTQLTDVTDDKVLANIDINIDLNGYKIQGTDNNRVISGLASYKATTPAVTSLDETEKTERNYNRLGQLNLSICDSSQDHQGALAVYGTYSGQTYTNDGVPQGCLIWIPKAGDTLNTYYTTLNASNATKGFGLVLYTSGIVNLYESHLIGGTAAGWIKTDSDGAYQKPGGATSGGGALVVDSEANVTMHGGTIEGGTAKYAYLPSTDGTYVDRAVGGGNVYVGGGTFTMNGGTISGGKVEVDADYPNTLPTRATGMGGGVYVNGGTFNVSGNVQITGNTNGSGNANNVFINDGTLNVTGALSDTAQIGITMVNYEGAFATATYDCAAKFTADEAGHAVSYDGANSRLYFAADGTYLVGYGIASIQPTAAQLSAGLGLNGYGNTGTRLTSKVTDHATLATTVGFDTDIKATALAVTDAQGDTVIVISVDFASVGDSSVSKVKSLVSAATGVPKDNITISATHQHSTPSITGDYANTFYQGVLDAAVAAYRDRKQSSVTVGTLETASDTVQYNFVRNVVINSDGSPIGMWTDNHKTHYYSSTTKSWYKKLTKSSNSFESAIFGSYYPDTSTKVSNVTLSYESEIDSTMQLVQFTQSDGNKIIMANFQTHPHLGASSSSYYVHSDIVGAFRAAMKTAGYSDVLYFSGASGNVNASTKITSTYSDNGDNLKYPVEYDMSTAITRLTTAKGYGDSLAALAANFLKTDGMKAGNGGTDVAAMVQTYTYTVWDDDPSPTKLANAEKLVELRNNGVDPTTFDEEYWADYVGNLEKDDRVYSFYHASKIVTRNEMKQKGETTGTFDITAYSLGDIGFVVAPYEMFQENGSDIKNGTADSTKTSTDYSALNTTHVSNQLANPFQMTIIATQANGGNGYIPSLVGYTNGGYSTDITLYNEGTAEDLVVTYLEMLNALKGK